MYITSRNFTTVLNTDGKTVCISGSSTDGFLIVMELKKNSIYNPVLAEFRSLLNFKSAEKAASYLLENCGYRGPVTISDRSLKSGD